MMTANRNINNTHRSCYLVALVVIASLALASGARHLTQASAFASSSSNGDKTYSSTYTTGGGTASASSSSGNNFSGSISQDGQGFSVASDGRVTVTSDGAGTSKVSIPSVVTSGDTNTVTSEETSAVTSEDTNTVIGEGSATAAASATGNGGTTQVVTSTTGTNPFTISTPLTTFLSTPKGAEDDSSIRAVSTGGLAVAGTSKDMPSCEDKGDFRYCCNYAHKYSDVCKCKFIPLHGSFFERFWECDAVRVSDAYGPTVWLDLGTGDQCYCA